MKNMNIYRIISCYSIAISSSSFVMVAYKRRRLPRMGASTKENFQGACHIKYGLWYNDREATKAPERRFTK